MACRRLPRRAVGPPPGARLQTPRSRRCCAGPSCAGPSGASGSGAEPSSRSSRKSAIGQLGRPSPHGNEPRQAAVGNFNLGQLWRRARTHTNAHTHTHIEAHARMRTYTLALRASSPAVCTTRTQTKAQYEHTCAEDNSTTQAPTTDSQTHAQLLEGGMRRGARMTGGAQHGQTRGVHQRGGGHCQGETWGGRHCRAGFGREGVIVRESLGGEGGIVRESPGGA